MGRTHTFKWFPWFKWGKLTKFTLPTKTSEVSFWRSQFTPLIWNTQVNSKRGQEKQWISIHMYFDCSNKQKRQEQQHVFVQENHRVTNYHNFFATGAKLGFTVITPKPNIRNCWTFHTRGASGSDRNTRSTAQFGRGPSAADDDQY